MNKHPSKSALSATPLTKRATKALATSSVDGNSALESTKGSGSNLSVLSPSSIVRENPEGTSPKLGDLEDEPEEVANEKSDKVSVPKPLESAKGSGTPLTESNPDASTSSSAIAHESSSWIANRIGRLENILDPTQMKEVVPPSVPRGRGTAEDKAEWNKFLHSTALIEQDASSARTTSSNTRESHARENASIGASSSVNKNAPPDPQLHPFNDTGDVDPRFELTDDIHEAMDALIEQGVKEVQ
jgi:hypothetical protein